MATNPMSGFIKKYKNLPSRAINAAEHPVDTLESLLGIGPKPKPAAPPDPYMLHNDPDIAAANQSYRDAAARQQPSDLRAKVRKKYPGMFSGQ